VAGEKGRCLLQCAKLRSRPRSGRTTAQRSTTFRCVCSRRRMGSVGQKEQMNQTPNAQHPTSNVEVSAAATTSKLRPRTSNILWRIVDVIVAGVFIYAGVLKVLDPVQFSHDIDNYRILPWTVSVALAFSLPWLEIFCGIALVFRFLYRAALSLLAALIVVFTLAAFTGQVPGVVLPCVWFAHAS